jgi:hypothetical protein
LQSRLPSHTCLLGAAADVLAADEQSPALQTSSQSGALQGCVNVALFGRVRALLPPLLSAGACALAHYALSRGGPGTSNFFRVWALKPFKNLNKT